MNIDYRNIEPWVSSKDIAQHLGVTIDTIRNWIKKKLFPAIKSAGYGSLKLVKLTLGL